jgi:cytidylate kinase
MAVITISRQYGSRGNEIAQEVRSRLGYHYFDKSLMAQVAAEVGLSEEEVVDFTEADYKVRGFLNRLFGRRSVAVESGARREGGSSAAAVKLERLDEDWCVRMVESTIRAACERGDVVIVGRGGQAILQDRPDVLHVRIEAPLKDRISRVRYTETFGLAPDLELAAAKETIQERDRTTAAYVKHFYEVDWDDPMLYHMVINSSKWGVEGATSLIVQAVECLPA